MSSTLILCEILKINQLHETYKRSRLKTTNLSTEIQLNLHKLNISIIWFLPLNFIYKTKIPIKICSIINNIPHKLGKKMNIYQKSRKNRKSYRNETLSMVRIATTHQHGSDQRRNQQSHAHNSKNRVAHRSAIVIVDCVFDNRL